MRNSINGGRTLRIGLASALVSLAVLILLLVTGGEGERQVWARLASANGLVHGSEVQAGGVDVGHVGKIRLGADGYPLVRLDISRDFPVRKGMRASLRFFSVGGEANRTVAITQGDGPELQDGAVLPRSQTDVPEEIDKVLSLLDPATRQNVDATFRTLERGTRGRGADIAAALRSGPQGTQQTAAVLGQLRADGAALRQLVSAGAATLRPLAADSGAVPAAADALGDLLSHTAAVQRDVGRSIAATPPALRAGRAAFARVTRSVPTLRRFIRDARPGLHRLAVEGPALERTLRAAEPALAQLRAVVGMVDQIRKLGRLVDVARPVLDDLRPALTKSVPVLGETRTRLPGAFGFLANWDDFHATYDAVGHSGRVGLVLSPTPTQAIGPNDAGPGELAYPFIRTPGAVMGEPWTSFTRTISPEPPR